MSAKNVKRHVVDATEPARVDLDIDPAIVEFIALKAQAFDAKAPAVEPDPGSNPIDDDDRGVLEDGADDETETELRDAVEQLSEDSALDLLTIFWIGRGDFNASEWAEARTEAHERLQNLSAYLMGEPNLGKFLEEGLSELGYRPEDLGVP